MKELVNGLQPHRYSKDMYTVPQIFDDFIFIGNILKINSRLALILLGQKQSVFDIVKVILLRIRVDDQ